MPVTSARAQLQFLPGRIIRDSLLKVLNSAVANATHNHGLEAAQLTVSSITINGGFAFKRFRPASRGMAHPFVKRTSHITVTVSGGSSSPKAPAKRGKKKADIVTISADQYAAESLDNDQEEKHEHVQDVKATPTPEKQDVPKSKEQEAFGKMRGLQSGGDQKKSFRRKSVG
jgi:Ribosomal protein L22